MSAVVVRLPDYPFHRGWEKSPRVEKCLHEWETVYAEDHPGHFVEVDRCVTCRAPRCTTRTANGECTQVRHHTVVHLFQNGEYEPLGGTP